MSDCDDVGYHDWIRDPELRGEGLICSICLITEAEEEHDDS